MNFIYIGSVTSSVKNTSTVKKGFTNPMIGVSQSTKSTSQVYIYMYVCVHACVCVHAYTCSKII